MIDFEAAAAGLSRAPEPDPDEPVDEEEAKRKKIFGHTLNEDGTLRCVSPSQHKNHKRCPRLWFYDKILKLPRKPKGKGAQLGTECHARMEKFLRTGVDIRGPLERHGDEMIRPYLPRAPFNGGDMLVEAPLLDPQLVTPRGIRISGFSDATLPPVNGHATVIDHKFKKKLDQYADTKEQLAAGDPQAVIYSAWALLKWPEARSVGFRHHNHQTQGARLNLPVSITDDRETVFAKWRTLGKYIDEDMARTALYKNAIDVPAAGDTDPSACRAFGGCDFLAECPSSPHNRYMNSLATGNLPEMPAFSRGAAEPPTTQGYDLMGLLDEMMDAPKPAATPTAPAGNAVPKALPPVEAAACKTGGVYMIPGGPVGKFEGVLGDRAIFKNKEGELLQCAPSDFVRDLNGDPVAVGLFEKKKKLNVVDVPPPGDTTPKIDPKAGIVPKDAPADTNPPKPPVETPVPAQTVVTAVASTPPATPPAEEPKGKPGRPAGSKNKAKVAADQFIILVNNACPAAEDLMPYVQGMCDALAKKEGIADVRLAPKTSDLGYGGWKAMLTVMCKTNPPPAGLYVIQQSELTEPVIEALSTVGIVSFGRGK